MLQESHLDNSEHAKLNKRGFKSVYFSSHSLGRRRGIVTLISSTLHYERFAKYKDKEGRFILIVGKIKGILMTMSMPHLVATGPFINICLN